MEITRNFVHREYGEIGEAKLVVPNGKWVLNGTELPEASVEHLATFALQTLQDAYAGAKSEDEATANFAKKLTRLLDGTLGVRTGSGSVNPLDAYVRKVIRANLAAKKAEYTAIPSDDQKARQEFLDACFAGLDDDKQEIVLERAQAMLDEDIARRKQVKKLASEINL